MTDDAAIDLVRALYQAFEEGDHEAIRRCLAEHLDWRQAGTAVPAAGQRTTGAEEFLGRVIVPLERDWDGFTEEVEDVFAVGARVVATGTYRGTYLASGRSVEAEFCHLWWVEDGEIRGFRQFTDTAAFAAATKR